MIFISVGTNDCRYDYAPDNMAGVEIHNYIRILMEMRDLLIKKY